MLKDEIVKKKSLKKRKKNQANLSEPCKTRLNSQNSQFVKFSMGSTLKKLNVEG
jgi:hypothetical protein